MTAIAIFVKTPQHSPVKTRLAAGIGTEAAHAMYRLAAQTVAEVAITADVGPVYWAVAEKEALEDPLWSGLPVIGQGNGSLGQRMACVHENLVEIHGSGLLLGADAPQIEAGQLQQASKWLSGLDARFVIGPAKDGGFWLFGANRLIEMERWSDVSYSRPDTLVRFRRALDGLGEWLTLTYLTDFDVAEDLPAVNSELSKLPRPSALQQEILELLRSL